MTYFYFGKAPLRRVRRAPSKAVPGEAGAE